MKKFSLILACLFQLSAVAASADCFTKYGMEIKRMTGSMPSLPMKTGLPFNAHPAGLKLTVGLSQLLGTIKTERKINARADVLNLLYENTRWGKGPLLEQELLPLVRAENPQLRDLSAVDLAFGLHDASSQEKFCRDGKFADMTGLSKIMAQFMVEHSNTAESGSRQIANARATKPSRAPAVVSVAEQRAMDESLRNRSAR